MPSPLRKPVTAGPPESGVGLVTADEMRAYLANCRYENWTYERIAEHLNLTPAFVGMVFTGQREPSKAFLEAAGFERVTLYRLKSVGDRLRAIPSQNGSK